MNLIFRLQINVRLLLSFQVCVARHAQITQNNKFAVSLQYLKKELSHDVDFVHADKHESLLQIDSMIWMGMVKHSQSSKNSKFAMSLQYVRQQWADRFKIPKSGCLQYFCNILRIIIATALYSVVMQNIQIIYRGPVMLVVTCYVP